MSDGYPLRPLGEVMRLDVQRIPMMRATTYRLAGVLNAGQGLVAKGEFDGAATEYSAMNVLRVDQVVMRKLTAWEGPITVVPAEFDGFVVSNEFPTFTLGPELIPGWIKHVCSSPRLWAEMKNRVTGTVQRRKRLNPEQLLQIKLPIPPREVQAGIVEIMDAVDRQVEAISLEANSLLKVRDAELTDILRRGGADWTTQPLADIGILQRGRRFTKSDYVDKGMGCIHYGQIYTHYGAWAEETLTFLPEDFRASARLAAPGDVVIAGTSENSADLGKAVAWLGSDSVAVHDDCFIFRHSLNPKFVSYFLTSSLFHEQKRQFISETKVARISAGNLKKIVMAIPPMDEQERIASVAAAIDSQVASLKDEAESLRNLRGALLSGTFSGSITIEPAGLER